MQFRPTRTSTPKRIRTWIQWSMLIFSTLFTLLTASSIKISRNYILHSRNSTALSGGDGHRFSFRFNANAIEIDPLFLRLTIFLSVFFLLLAFDRVGLLAFAHHHQWCSFCLSLSITCIPYHAHIHGKEKGGKFSLLILYCWLLSLLF